MPVERLLIGYDGSRAARHAIEVAAEMFPGASAVVAHVRDAASAGVVPVASPGAPFLIADETLDAEAEKAGRAVAEEGAGVATEAGLRARPETVVGSGARGVADALISLGSENRAQVIVTGARGHSAVAAALLGSVCDALVHRSAQPVLVVPASVE